MPTHPNVPTLDSLRLQALEEILVKIDVAAALKQLPSPRYFMGKTANEPTSLNYMVAMTAMKLAIDATLEVVAARVQLEVRKPGRTAYAVKYNYNPPPPGEPTEIVVDTASLLELKKLFV